jgi:hypothetical protein
MTVQGTIILLIIGLALQLWILNLVRRDRLYAGYGVFLSVAIAGVMLVVAVPPLLAGVTRMVGAIFPVSALTLLALGFIFVMLVYVLTQVTILSNRLAAAIQELAVQRTKEDAKRVLAGQAPER